MPGFGADNPVLAFVAMVLLVEKKMPRALKSTLVPLAQDVNRIGVDGIDTDDVATARRVLVAIIDNLARSEDVATER